jgi:hypothetical protein
LFILDTEPEEQKRTREMLKSIQHDLMFLHIRKGGQIIDDRIRQTDLVLKDHRGRLLFYVRKPMVPTQACWL